MSLLALLLPTRRRPGAHPLSLEGGSVPGPLAPWAHVYSADGQVAGPLRFAPAAALPKADQVVLVLAAADVSWHRIRLPKAAGARMRLALLGALEEHLLEEDGAVHLALAAGASPGQEGWVAAVHAPHLKAGLAALESCGIQVSRVVSALPEPSSPLRAHFAAQDEIPTLAGPGLGQDSDGAFAAATAAAGEGTHWSLTTASGSWHLPLPVRGVLSPGGGLQPPIAAPHQHPKKTGPQRTSQSGDLASALRNGLPEATPEDRWTCTPAAAAAAERFMGRPVPVVSPASHVLERAQSATNLRQFDLQPRHRGLAALRGIRQQLARREWRTVRAGLWALAAVQLLGLNAVAWTQQQALQARRQQIDGLLRSTFPNERTVLDAPAQMRAQTQRLRAAAGQPGPADLESALAAAAAAWPEGKPAVSALRYEAARLTLASAGWQEAEVADLRQRLQAYGWKVAYADNLLTLQHHQAAPSGAPGAVSQ